MKSGGDLQRQAREKHIGNAKNSILSLRPPASPVVTRRRGRLWLQGLGVGRARGSGAPQGGHMGARRSFPPVGHHWTQQWFYSLHMDTPEAEALLSYLDTHAHLTF